MFGTNEVAKARPAEEGFLVHSIFYTIQGEGPLAGHPAVFLRLAGCNLRCFWCDTDFEKGQAETVDELATRLHDTCANVGCKLVVITGGEPLLQEVGLLLTHPLLLDMTFQIETAGSVWPNSLTPLVSSNRLFGDDRLTIVCSPKTPSVHPMIEQHADYFKYIIRVDETAFVDGLPSMSTQSKNKPQVLFRPRPGSRAPIYVQACDEPNKAATSRRNLLLAAQIAMRFGYRLSVQLHKIVGLD